MVIKKIICIVDGLQGSTVPAGAQSAFHRADSILTLMKLSLVPFLMVILGAFPQEGIAQVNILAQNGGWLAIKDGENTYGMRL